MMKRLIIILITVTFGSVHNSKAQTFNGFQTIGQHSAFFSIAWQGKPYLGLGYNFRNFGTTFTDFQGEIRFPIDKMFQKSDYQVIVGFYRPHKLAKAYVGYGGHLKYTSQDNAGTKHSSLVLQLSGLPSYAYVRSIDNGPYGTVGARISYSPEIVNRTGNKKQYFKAHSLAFGGHFDIHLQRTASFSLNGASNLRMAGSTKTWYIESDFYFGSTYLLKRSK